MTAQAAAFARARSRTFWGLLIGYAAFYLCRNNLSAAASLLDTGLHIDKVRFGQIASAGTLCYAVGQVLAGPFSDRFGGRRIFLIGLYVSAVANLAMALGGPLGLWIGLWSLSRLFQSLGWAGLVQIMPNWFPQAQYGTAMGAISTSYQLGSAVTPLIFSGLMLVTTGWQPLFALPGVALILTGLAVQRWIAQRPSAVGLPDLEPQADAPPPVAPEGPRPPWYTPLKLLLARPSFWIVLALSFSLTLIRETFSLWMPRYFADLGAANAAAVLKSTAFPVLGLTGTLLAGWVSDRFSSGRRGPIMAVMLLGLVASLLGLAHVHGLAARAGVEAQTLALPLTGLVGFCLLGPYSMVGGGVVALDFGGKDAAASAAGLLDGVGYLGASLAGVGVAAVVDHAGWAGAWQVLAALSGLSVVLCLPLWKR